MEYKKKVLYFIPEFPRISETFIEREVSRLIELGNLDINILSLSKASGSTSEKVLNKTIYKRLNYKELFLGMLYILKKPQPCFECLKILMSAKNKSLPSKIYFFIKALGYTKIISDLKPNHIHAHFLSWPSTTALIASKILNIPFSISAHAKDVFVEGELVAAKVNAAKFVSICNSFAYNKALDIAGNNVDKSKIKLIYHGIDAKIFDTPPQMPKWDTTAIFLGGTRLVEKKGITYMVQASKILKEQNIKHRVDLVGPGDQYEQILKMIKDLDLEDTIFVHGEGKGMPFSQVLEFYKIADIFVLPSIETNKGDADGVPTVCIEAAMAKLPIVATNAGGITDLVEDNVSGIIVPQRDPVAIANAIKNLMQNKDLAQRLAQNAYNKATQMFDIEKNIKALEELLGK